MKLSDAKITVTLIMALALGLTPKAVKAVDINPFDFNVYSLSNIGTSSSGYGSDYQGIAGAAGSAYFSGFSLNDLAQIGVVPGFSLVTGADASISGSINNGGINAGGSVYVNGASIFGNVVAGGNLNGSGGTVNGNATLGGVDNTSLTVTVTGTVTQNTSYVGSLNYAGINQYLTDFSTSIGSQTDTTSYNNINSGDLIINLTSGDNYVTIDGATLNSAYAVTITGASDSVLYINVDGVIVNMDSTNWAYNGGVTADNVLLNFDEADTLSLSGGNTVNILAPLADVNFSSGLVTGNLIVGNLTGGGQVNLGGFNHNVVPEPSSALVLLGSTVMLAIRRRTRRRGA